MSTGIFNSGNNYESRKWFLKKQFLYFYFSIVHISINDVLGGLKC